MWRGASSEVDCSGVEHLCLQVIEPAVLLGAQHAEAAAPVPDRRKQGGGGSYMQLLAHCSRRDAWRLFCSSTETGFAQVLWGTRCVHAVQDGGVVTRVAYLIGGADSVERGVAMQIATIKHCTANSLFPSIPSLGPRRCCISVFPLRAAPKRQHGDNFAASARPHRYGCCRLERFRRLPDRLPVCLQQSRRLTAAPCWR